MQRNGTFWVGRIGLAVLLALGFVSATAARDRSRGMNGTLWVTDRTLNQVFALDAATGDVLATIQVGAEPNDVIVPRGTNKVYVTNEASNSVMVIDKRTLAVIKTITTGPKPHHIDASPNGRYVYFGEFGTNWIGVIDTRTDEYTSIVASENPNARTHAVFTTSNGKRLLVANTAINEAAIIDARTGTVLDTITVSDNPNPTANNPSEVIPANNGRLAYATVRADNKLVVIDLKQGAIIDETLVGTQPDTIHLTPNGKMLFVGLRGTPAQVALVDAATLEVTHVNLPGGTTGHNDGSANGRYSLVVVEKSASSFAGVAVVDNRTQQFVTLYPTPGNGRPHGLDWEPQRLHQ